MKLKYIIGIITAAVLMMLPTIMGASADTDNVVIIEPEDPGNDVGICTIGVPSPCNDPDYWFSEGWNWDRWIHNRLHPIPTIPYPPIVTLPVEPYELASPEPEQLPVEEVPVDPQGNNDLEHVISITKEGREDIQKIPGVVATGITGSDITGVGEDEYQVLISLDTNDPETIAKLPQEINGVRVLYDVTGPIQALTTEEPRIEQETGNDVQTTAEPDEPVQDQPPSETAQIMPAFVPG